MHVLYRLLRLLLFRLDAERAHELILGLVGRIGRWLVRLRPVPRTHRADGSPYELAGVPLPNPVGLAPGFVKDPRFRWAAPAMGFGFVEVGTLTRLPQAGNPRPRLFRLPADQALVNRMGFNNPGYHQAVEALRGGLSIPVGVNLGKGKRTPTEGLLGELAEGVSLFSPVADFFVVNLSSPNTPGLRALLEPERLDGVLAELAGVRERAARLWGCHRRPLLLKLHPDLEAREWEGLLAWLPRAELDGVIATNTTTGRTGLASEPAAIDAAGGGGLSGPVLAPRRERMLAELRSALPPDRALVAVGGIRTAADVKGVVAGGAAACEVYTGLIFEGPAMVRELVRSAGAV